MAAYKTGAFVRSTEILYPVLENASAMDTPFKIRTFKITTPLGGIGNVYR